MNKTWLAATIAMTMTLGVGAGIMTGEGAGAEYSARNAAIGEESTLEEAAARPWMHPEVAVVMKVPAAGEGTFDAASGAAKHATSADAASNGAAEGPWVHPAVTVVVKVPQKADRGV